MKICIISISSDFGIALANHWHDQGHTIVGTFRRRGAAIDELIRRGLNLISCDLADSDSVDAASHELSALAEGWDALVIAPGLQDPVGPFEKVNFKEWAQSFEVNFTAPMNILHALLPRRNHTSPNGPLVLLFAGGGTNNATVNYSAYTIAKISSIKICELLDAEIPDSRFAIIGPGWVKTKIHESTLRAVDGAGENLQRTVEKLKSDDCVPMSKVVECVDWTLTAPREVIGGRNFSLVYDDWGSPALDKLLREDKNMYKLRRSGNEKLQRATPISERAMRSTQK